MFSFNRLAVNVKQSGGSITTINALHETCKVLAPQPTKDLIAKLIKLLFNVDSSIVHQNGEKIIVYNGLDIIKDSESSDVLIPPLLLRLQTNRLPVSVGMSPELHC